MTSVIGVDGRWRVQRRKEHDFVGAAIGERDKAFKESSNAVRRDRRLGDKFVRSVIAGSKEDDSTEVRVGDAATRGHGRRLEAR